MKRFVTSLAWLAALATVTLWWGNVFVRSAIAQTIKAAIVKSIDEPGRNPYQGYRGFSSLSQSSDGSYLCQTGVSPVLCTVLFPTVPPGKRLVLETVSGVVYADKAANVTIFVSAYGPGGGPNLDYFVAPLAQEFPPFQGGFSVHASMKHYIDAGQQPGVRAELSPNANVMQGVIAVSGYLVDITQ